MANGGGAGEETSLAGGAGGTSFPVAFQPAPVGLRLLTVSQYVGSLTALLGQPQTVVIDGEQGSEAAARGGVSPVLVEQYETATNNAVRTLFAAVDKRSAVVPCTPTDATDDTCTVSFLKSFGRKAWRRPLTAAEAARYQALAVKASRALQSPWRGLEFAVRALLQSPNFLYRVELGETDPGQPSQRRFTAYELAARLAFLIWNVGPDAVLLDAAEQGNLGTSPGLAAQADRLLTDARANLGVGRFFEDWWGLDDLTTLDKDKTIFPLASSTLGAAMQTEIRRAMDDVVFVRKVDMHDIFTGRSTFANEELDRYYGVSPVAGSAGWHKAEWPADGPRQGMLGFPGILAMHAKPNKTFPTGRGKFIREALLCQSIPPPPPNVNTSLDVGVPGETLTMRQRLERHQKDPSCAGCHTLMDPLGLALENFDGLGLYRALDNGLSIDPSGSLDGVPFKDARGLSQALATNPATMTCLVRQLYRYAEGHREGVGEERAIQELDKVFRAKGFKMLDLVKAMATHEDFRQAGQL